MKHLFPLLLFLVFISSGVVGQDLRNPNTKFLTKRGYTFPDSTKKYAMSGKISQWPDTMYYNTMYRAKLMGSLTIPITFSSIEISNGNAVVSPNVSLGLGYTWFYGDFVFNEDDKMTVYPTFFFGVIGDAGIENNFSLNKLAGFFAGGFVGIGAFTLFGGYDIINKYALIGLGGRVDFFTISQKFLHVFGKVEEVRKHKSIALPITGE
ncbi:MAG TPA: hypothetical protein VK806_10590 [Bacteroidia bacterium]|jgi:hypothetical protein|nr:hypothetical protein [Bacteroidia bacterium]